jgi:hypothetical protein
MVGVSPQKFMQDIIDRSIIINFGVLTITNGIHITLPTTFEGLDINGMILKSPKQSLNSFDIKFI